jgi:hypothetical protein
LTGGVATTDEILSSVYDGNAFQFVTYFKVLNGKTKKILVRRPDGKYGIMLAVYAISKYPMDMRVVGEPTVTDYGDLILDPVPLPRNTDPLKFRIPHLQIYEGVDFSGGVNSGKVRIEHDMKDNSINYLERAIYAHSSGEGKTVLEFKNYHPGDNWFNLFITWSEYLM